MKRFCSAFVCVILLVAVVLSCASCDNSGAQVDKLVVYNSADYIYDTDLTDFKEYYFQMTGRQIDVTYVTFDTNETMLTKITKGDSVVDVVCPSEYAIQKLLEGGHLVKLNYFDEDGSFVQSMSKYEGYEHNSDKIDSQIIAKIDEAFSDLTDPNEQTPQKMTDYFVPYMYGTLGILYNKYAFADMGIYNYETINNANWGILFNDDGNGNILAEGLKGNILMKDSIRDSYAVTLFYMQESGKLDKLKDKSGKLYTEMSAGELINVADEQVLNICREVLTEQKQQLFGYEVDFGKDDLLKGNATVDLAWSGDAMYAVEESWDDYLCPNCMTQSGVEQGEGDDVTIVCAKCGEECGDYELGYYVPHTNGNIWFDGWVVPKTHDPEHIDAIKLFINFLNSPYAAANNLIEIGYSSAVSREAVMQTAHNDEDVRGVLCSAYLVNDDSWDKLDEKGKTVTEFDFDSWEEFEDYFFYYRDEMDNSNWRYPFDIESVDDDYDRSLTTLGVMRDFGENNKAVVTMWNGARSKGVSALPLLGWTALAVAVAVGIVVLCEYIKHHKNATVIIRKADQTEQPNDQTNNISNE
ncbi:MAG: extracellular solute-binding protein [Clostridia bacterium]|nr:extracellular solute-binding protein [Clostridia bacterium]